MLEVILLLAACLFIAVLFYKQANEQIELLQLEADRKQDLPNVLSERSPIILRGYATPTLGTPETCKQRPSLAPLFQYDPATFPLETRRALAQESGLDIWFEHTWLPLLTSPFTRFYTSPSSRMIVHKEGLQQTSAPITFIMPTQGSFIITLMTQSQIPFLPVRWKGRQFEGFTALDTPLLNRVVYTQVKLRVGHIFLLPPHILFDIQTCDEEMKGEGVDPLAWAYCVELHHPISRCLMALSARAV